MGSCYNTLPPLFFAPESILHDIVKITLVRGTNPSSPTKIIARNKLIYIYIYAMIILLFLIDSVYTKNYQKENQLVHASADFDCCFLERLDPVKEYTKSDRGPGEVINFKSGSVKN